MKPLICAEVLEQIELYAAGECDEATRAAIQQHLAHCAACSKAEQEARQLVGLLDLRLQESDRLGRLQARLRSEEKRPKSVKVLPFARRIAALAAMLLLAVGLSVWFRAQESSGYQDPVVVAWGPSAAVRAVPEALNHKPAIAVFKAHEDDRVYDLDLGGLTPKQFRQAITAAKERAPMPPLVNLSLMLRNTTEEELTVHVGGEGSELKLDLQGPGAVFTRANKVTAEFLIGKPIILKPGQNERLPISRLVFGTRENVRVAYWTEPGEFTLTVRYKVAVSHGKHDSRFVVLRSPPLHFQVRLKEIQGK